MSVNQISVFLENRAGQLSRITKLLGENHIDLRAINIAETADYGLLRLIVDDSSKASNVLLENGFIITKTPVIAIAVPDVPGGLNGMLEILVEQNIDINYMYSLFGDIDNNAYMVLQVSDIEKARAVLEKADLKVATNEDLDIK